MFIVTTAGFAEQTLNKSRFVASAQYCDSERAVSLFLRSLAAQNPSAHHLAYAFRIKTPDGIIPRFSDAGEPSGTAGKPILQILEGRDLINICVGVIRYYGGVNLGTGGLARAYSGTGRLSLDACKTAPFVEMQIIKLNLDYKQLDGFIREPVLLNGHLITKDFGAYVVVTASVPATEVAGLMRKYQQ